LLESGGIWRQTLKISSSGRPGKSIVFGHYGTGTNPKLIGSAIIDTWQDTGIESVRISRTSVDNPSHGQFPSEVFFVFENDRIEWGNFKNVGGKLADLERNFEWYMVKGHLYFFLDDSIAGKLIAIEVPERTSCIRIDGAKQPQDIVIDGLDMFFAKVAGVECGRRISKASGLRVENAHLGYFGVKEGDAGYGISSFYSDFIVENCTIHDCGRRGISFNIYAQSPVERINQAIHAMGGTKFLKARSRIFSNILIKNNTFFNGQHTTALDLAIMPGCTGTMIQDVTFAGNFTSEDSLIRIGENNNHTSNQVFLQEGGGRINRVYIYSNIFLNATSRHLLFEGGDTIHVVNNTIAGFNQYGIPAPYGAVSFNFSRFVDFRNNILYLNLPDSITDHGVLMYHEQASYIQRDNNLYFQLYGEKDLTGGYHGYYNASNWELFRRRYPEFEMNSPFPSDPGFISFPGNLSIGEDSPANSTGITVDFVDMDYFGYKLKDPPDIGAIQNWTNSQEQEVRGPDSGVESRYDL